MISATTKGKTFYFIYRAITMNTFGQDGGVKIDETVFYNIVKGNGD